MSAVSGKQSLHVVQISDCHLGERDGDTLLGLDTDRSLDAVLRQLRAQPQADLLVLSGDLASDGQRDAYLRLLRRCSGLARRVVWLPGNHDDAGLMRQVVGDELMPASLQLDGWQLLFLNSAVVGEVGGTLAQTELDRVHTALASKLPTLLFLHHHVLPIGCAWLDEQRVSNGKALLQMLAGQNQVKALISGHVHQQSDTVSAGLRQLTTPSSCIQFAPGSEQFALDTTNPGYRTLQLQANGDFETQVERVPGVFTVDRHSGGYR